MVQRAAADRGTAKNTSTIFCHETLVDAITSDPGSTVALRFVGRCTPGFFAAATPRCGPSMAGARNSSNKTAIRALGFCHSTISSSNFMNGLLQRHGSEQSALHGVEMAAGDVSRLTGGISRNARAH